MPCQKAAAGLLVVVITKDMVCPAGTSPTRCPGGMARVVGVIVSFGVRTPSGPAAPPSARLTASPTAIMVVKVRLVTVCWSSAVIPNAHSQSPVTGTSRAPKADRGPTALERECQQESENGGDGDAGDRPHVHALTM